MRLPRSEKEEHPSWGLVGFSRVTGRRTMFGSDLVHNEFITLRISRAERERTLANDFLFGRNQLIEIALTPNQFASLLTTMNVGSGVPCTIDFIAGESIPRYEEPPRVEQHRIEMQRTSEEVKTVIKEVYDAIDAANLPKGKTATLKSAVSRVERKVTDVMPFILEQYHRAMDNVTTDAKAAVEAFVMGAITRTGLQALQSKKPTLIESREVEE